MILIVDDDPVVCRAVKSLFINQGYGDVQSVHSGKEAFELIKTGQVSPDLMILDLMMPEMNGNQVMEKMKEEGIDCPVIVLSGYLGELKECSLVKGAIEKPPNSDILLQEVGKWVHFHKPVQ